MANNQTFNRLDRAYSEKRGFVRMNINAEATVKSPHCQEAVTTTCHNLSGSGIMFESQQMFNTDTEIEVQLKATSDKFHNLHAKANIIRCDFSKDDNTFLIAAKFSKIL